MISVRLGGILTRDPLPLQGDRALAFLLTFLPALPGFFSRIRNGWLGERYRGAAFGRQVAVRGETLEAALVMEPHIAKALKDDNGGCLQFKVL